MTTITAPAKANTAPPKIVNGDPDTIASPPKILAFNEADLREFLRHIVDPETGSTEMRLFKAKYGSGGRIVHDPQYGTAMSGWYDNIDAIVADARKLRQVSAYICLNPASPDLLARSYNKLAGVRSATNDNDIVCLRWLYVDIDPERPADISSTDEELSRAIEIRDRILADHPEIARVCLRGISANGGFIMARLPDYPNDAEHRKVIADALDSLVATYSTPAVKIDVKTKNPSRVGCFPGTLKCKGSHIPARPWRLATLDGVPKPGDVSPPTLDLRAWLENNPVVPVRPVSVARQTSPSRGFDDRAHRIKRAAAYLDRVPEAVSGQDGHGATFRAACILIKGFDLSISEARPIMDGYSKRCQPEWLEKEIEHKLDSAEKEPDTKPRGYLFDAERPGYTGPGADFVISQPDSSTPQPPPIDPTAINARAAELAALKVADLYRDKSFLADLARLESQDPGEGAAIESILKKAKGFAASAFNKAMKPHRDAVANPTTLRQVASPAFPIPDGLPEFRPTDMGNANLFAHAHGHEARYVNAYGSWVIYDGKRWAKDDRNVASQWAQQIPGLIGAQIRPDMSDETIEAIVAWQAKSESKERLAAVLDVAKANLTISPDQFDRDPLVFNCQNGTIDLLTGKLKEHNPKDLITKISPVVYDSDAKCPRWERFEEEVFAGNKDLIRYARKLSGYALSGLNTLQEIYIFCGKGGNGKNIFSDTNREISGDYGGMADPELVYASLHAQHPTNIADLAGKRYVAVSESEKDRELNESVVKRLTGDLTMKARFMAKDFFEFDRTHKLFLSVNHKPVIKGQDNGIWRRVFMIPFDVQFVDPSDPNQEPVKHPTVLARDEKLQATLRSEYSGILNLFLGAFRDFQTEGMRPPESVVVATRKYREEMDPLKEWVDARVTLEDDLTTPAADLYSDYVQFQTRSRREPITQTAFGTALTKRKIFGDREGENRTRVRIGIGLGKKDVIDWLKGYIFKVGIAYQSSILQEAASSGFSKDDVYQAKRALRIEETIKESRPAWQLPIDFEVLPATNPSDAEEPGMVESDPWIDQHCKNSNPPPF